MLMAAAAHQLKAMPALPHPVTVVQPDGTKVTVLLRGDEHLHWAETLDGFTLLRDNKGYFTFAKTGKSGKLEPSTLRFTGSSQAAKLNGIKPGLRFLKSQVEEAFAKPLSSAFNKPEVKTARRKAKAATATDKSQFMVDGTFPATGRRKLLVLLVNYQDTRTTYSREAIDRMMNQENYNGIGSLRDYYLEQSYGKLDLDITVTDWITLPKPKGTYGADGAAYMIYDALSSLSGKIDLSQFDNDGDGILDGLAVIHQGTGQEASGSTSDIWSHSSIIYGQKFNGVTVRRYTIEPEINAKTMRLQEIGVIAHEFGHALGAPDFYDSDYASSGGEFCGTGIWDLLCNGAWSGDYGSRPTGINGWQKWVWGWTEPTVLEENMTVTGMESATDKPVAYRMETGTPGEYFFMENRQNTKGFDRSLPGHGLIVYHVDENIIKSKVYENTINATYPQGIYMVCADAGVEPDAQPSSFGQVNTGYAPFPGLQNYTDFSDNTLPSAKSRDGRASYRALSNITDVDGKVGFTFTHLAEPVKPTALAAVTTEGKVRLTWAMEGEAKEVDHYNVYRDDAKVAETTERSFTDGQPTGGKIITYKVDAAYKDGKLSHPTETSILVPENKVTDMTADAIADNLVVMTWNIDNVLSRADIFKNGHATVDIYGDEVEYVNCYTPADLQNYVGSNITKISFVPSQGPSELTVKLRVYEGEADGSGMKVVAERSVGEFATGQEREVKLTSPVTIKDGKTYWIAVWQQCAKGVCSPMCDTESLIAPGRGNCVMKNGKFVAYNEAPGNFYVAATLSLASSSEGTEFDAAPGSDFDIDNDLFFPLCYVVHCDGEPVAYTTKRSKVFVGIPAGTHTFSVSSYFNGGNESARLAKTVTVDGEVTAVEGVTANNGGNGSTVVSTVDGRVVRRLSHKATTAEAVENLPSGLYIVDGKKVVK